MTNELDNFATNNLGRVVRSWVEGSDERRRKMDGAFKPLVSWPPGTEYLQKVSLPDTPPLADRIVDQLMLVFSIYDLKPCRDTVSDLVKSLLKG